ncbi:hypothetical protein JYU34_004171 [Plutella xylostella]|uniref:Odorant receptor n=1 Tax=Plutella xylostella TaxID=51655 RepID=A0ABQ7QX99_PLUXY|nr:hypothetical protein JYU34_004171 [Plutella xylostella]
MEKLSYKSLSPHVRMLQVSGILPLARDTPPWKYRLHQAYTALMTVIPYLYALQNLGHMYKVRHDAVQVMDSMFLLLSYINMIYKKMVLLLDADQVYELLHVMKGPLFNQDDAAHREILANHAARAFSSLKLFHYLALCSCFFWMAFPTFEHFRGYDLYFPLWMPIDPNKPVNFYIVMLYLFVQWEYHAVVQCTFDLFASYMLAQCTTQVYILRLDLESAVERSHEKARQENISFSDAFHQVFTVSLLHYNEISRMVTKTQKVFGGAAFCQICVTGWIICTTAYRVVDSDKILNSAYSMDWLQLPVTHRRSLLIFLERVRTPIQVVAGHIIPLSAATLVQAMSELAFSSMEPHLRVLRASGSYHLDRASTPPWRYRLHRVYMGFVIFLPYLYVAQELAYVYTVRGNPDQVIYGLFKLFSYIDFIYKKMVLLLKADRVEKLLNTMKGPLFNQEGLHHREILLTQVSSAKSTLYIFNFMGNLSCLVWLLVPIVQYSRGHEIRFPLLFPVEINKAPKPVYCTDSYFKMNPASVEFCSMITYITCVMVELVLYCLFGNRLAIEASPRLTTPTQ